VNSETINSIVVIHLDRTVLQPDSEALRKHLEELYERKIDKLILDFTSTDHICSSALGNIVYMKNRMKSYDGTIRLVIHDDDLLELMDITMLNQVFKIFHTLEEALHSFYETNLTGF
jgi:anti-anti-sigma factor